MNEPTRFYAPPIIGIFSPGPRHGKSSLGAATLKVIGTAVVIPFAEALRREVSAEMTKKGLHPAEIRRLLYKDKSDPINCYGGKTARQLMQEHGAARRKIDKAYWIKRFAELAKPHLDAGVVVIADDTRYLNEAAHIRDCGGELWRVERPGVINPPEVMEHESEQELISYEEQRSFLNNGSLADLEKKVECSLLSEFPRD